MALQAAQLCEEALVLGALGARRLLAQARQVALDIGQLDVERSAVERVGGERLIGELNPPTNFRRFAT